MKRLQKCCCCASTRTGTIVTAILGILLSIATIIIVWLLEKSTIKFTTLIFDQDLDRRLSDLEIPRIILTVNLCFTILISTLLIVAVVKRRSWLMLPWVVLGIVLAIGLLISVLHISITYYIDDSTEDHNIFATVILVGGLLYLCLYLYLWAVVFSHYLDTRDEEERGRYRKAPYRR